MDLKTHVINGLQKGIDWVFAKIPQPEPDWRDAKKVKVVAHRGVHDNLTILENTVAGFDLAIKHKVWGIEFDIRWTRDLVPVLHHDPTLLRVHGWDTPLSEVTFDELRKRAPRVPSLEEIVRDYGKKIHFFIELKEEVFPETEKQKMVLTEVLKPLTPVEDFYFLSLTPRPFEVFNQFDPKSYFFVGDFNVAQLGELAIQKNYGGITGHYLLTGAEMIKKHRSHDQLVGTGFVASDNVLRREISRGVDWIFTNDAVKVQQSLERLAGRREA